MRPSASFGSIRRDPNEYQNTPPDTPRSGGNPTARQHQSTSPSPPQPIPIQTVQTPGRPPFAMPTPPGIPQIAHTPDRPPRQWAMPHHNHHGTMMGDMGGGQHSQPLQARQDVIIDGSLETNELVGLDLSSARIRSLPLGLLNYTDFLTEVRLNGNLLTGLPAEVGELRSLVILDLSDNLLTHLPPEIGKLTNLVELLLYNNRLHTLPPEFGYLYQLEMLGVEGNPWEDPIAGLLMTQGPLAVVPFLRDNVLGIILLFLLSCVTN